LQGLFREYAETESQKTPTKHPAFFHHLSGRNREGKKKGMLIS
jgi:hypothetical protein